MEVAPLNIRQAYHNHLSVARAHFGARYFSPKRITKNAALVFGIGTFLSYAPGLQFVLGIPLLWDWHLTSRERKTGNPDLLLRQLVKSCAPIETVEIYRDLFAYDRKGQVKMAAEFLLRLKEEDYAKFEKVLDLLKSSKNSRNQKILREFDRLNHDSSYAYRSSLERVQLYFSYTYFSAIRMVRNALVTLFLINYTPMDDLFGIDASSSPLGWLGGTLGIYLSGSALVEWLGARRTRKKANASQLLDDLIQTSLEVKASTLARDLASYNRRGLKEMGKEYLLKLKETCGTKFNEVLALLQESRRGRSLAATFVQNT